MRTLGQVITVVGALLLMLGGLILLDGDGRGLVFTLLGFILLVPGLILRRSPTR